VKNIHQFQLKNPQLYPKVLLCVVWGREKKNISILFSLTYCPLYKNTENPLIGQLRGLLKQDLESLFFHLKKKIMIRIILQARESHSDNGLYNHKAKLHCLFRELLNYLLFLFVP